MHNMHLKKYVFFSFLIILSVGLFVYSQIGSKYTLEFFGIPVTLSVAFWVVLPMILLFIGSYLHMAYYSFKNYLKIKKYKKDYDKVINSFFSSILREPRQNNYKTQELRNIGSVIDRSYIVIKEFNFDYKEDLIRKAVQYVKDIQRGEFVDIKEINLSPTNPIFQKNLENRMKEEPTYSGVILRKCDEFGRELCKKALNIFITYAEISKIKDYAKHFDKESLFNLLKIAKDKNKDLNLNISDLIYILQESKISMESKEYIELAKEVKELYLPDERLRLFEQLKEIDEKAEEAFVYTLFDLEMIDKAKDELENSEEFEFLRFKAFLELKECGKNYPLELFV